MVKKIALAALFAAAMALSKRKALGAWVWGRLADWVVPPGAVA